MDGTPSGVGAHDQRQLGQVGHPLPRGRRQPHGRRRGSRPMGPPSRPRRCRRTPGRSDCATCPTVMPSEPASPRLSWTSSSGFCPRVESPTSTAPGTLATSAAARCARVGEHARVFALHLDLDRLHRAAEPAGEDRHAGPADLLHLGTEQLPQLFLAQLPIRLGHQAHVDQRLIHRGRLQRQRRADRRVGVGDLLVRARAPGRFLRLDPGVLEVGARIKAEEVASARI